MKNSLTAQRLRFVLSYDPSSGVFVWLVNHRSDLIGHEAGSVKPRYRDIKVDGVLYKAHRLAWLYVTSEWPSMRIDHKDTDTQNNRFENLRLATHSQNIANSRRRSDNTSGFKGVHLQKSTGRWVAYINKDCQRFYLGQFDSAESAHQAYTDAANKLHGTFSRSV